MVEHHPSRSMGAGSSPALRSTFMAANAQADAQQDRNGIATVIDGMRGYPHKRGFSAIPHAGDQHRPLPPLLDE